MEYPIIYNGNDMLHVFGDIAKSLDVLYVLEDKKPVARISVKDDDYEKAEAFCRMNGLSIKRSHEKILKNIHWEGHDYAGAVMVDATIPSKGDYFVYISKHDSLVQRAKVADFLNDHEQLGSLLGYPKCCIDHYRKIKGNEYAYANDFVSRALDNSSFKVSLINVIPRHVGLSLISHYPCSFDCTHSIRIAEQHLEAIRKHSPELADHILDVIRSPVLYTRNGVHVLLGHWKDGQEIFFQGVLSSANNGLHDSLRSAGRISSREQGLILFR